MEYDLFISHASEDKDDVVRPLVAHLNELGLKVWVDELELTIGDSLRRNIDKGLSRSRFGAVVISPAFVSKEWPNKELDALVSREDGGDKVILPIWHRLNHDEVRDFSPLLAGKLAVSTSGGIAHVAEKVRQAISVAADDGQVVASSEPPEDELLQRISQQMLSAPSLHDLRRTSYELEEYLDKYPRSADARMLQDKLHQAVRWAEAMEAPADRAAPSMEKYLGWEPRRLPAPLGCSIVATAITFALLAYLVYLLVRWLFF